LLSYQSTPVQELHDAVFEKAGVRVLVKREDLNHPYVSGNKWWKLKYNLEEASKQGKKTLLTFGGAYSNHVYATAATAHELGFTSIAIIRGEETLPLNPTLRFAKERGTKIYYVTREAYRTKSSVDFIQPLYERFGDFYLIPEGGTNALAVKGVEEFAHSLGNEFDYLCCAMGTGGTLAGLIRGLINTKEILGFPVLMGGAFLKEEVEKLIGTSYTHWKLFTDYHFGGYAKTTPELLHFISRYEHVHNHLLDQVYTGKLFYGIYDLIRKQYFSRGSTILILHSGGLQGRTL
jgi:1-aminocyclopropane-1-carboxylate deaminase